MQNWLPDDMPYAFYTELELSKIHRSFGHADLTATKYLLWWEKEGCVGPNYKRAGQQDCGQMLIFETLAPTPRRFNLTIGTGDLSFNHELQGDTMFLYNKPILDMVETAAHFCSAAFLKSQSSRDI